MSKPVCLIIHLLNYLNRYAHVLSYSKDGNFMQSQHDKKMDKDDFPLTKGASYYAHEDEYASYLERMSSTDADKEVILIIFLYYI